MVFWTISDDVGSGVHDEYDHKEADDTIIWEHFWVTQLCHPSVMMMEFIIITDEYNLTDADDELTHWNTLGTEHTWVTQLWIKDARSG